MTFEEYKKAHPRPTQSRLGTSELSLELEYVDNYFTNVFGSCRSDNKWEEKDPVTYKKYHLLLLKWGIEEAKERILKFENNNKDKIRLTEHDRAFLRINKNMISEAEVTIRVLESSK